MSCCDGTYSICVLLFLLLALYSHFICNCVLYLCFFFFFSSRRRHTRFDCDWSSDVCSSDLPVEAGSSAARVAAGAEAASAGDGSAGALAACDTRPGAGASMRRTAQLPASPDRKSVV